LPGSFCTACAMQVLLLQHLGAPQSCLSASIHHLSQFVFHQQRICKRIASCAPARGQLGQLPTCTYHEYKSTDKQNTALIASLSSADCGIVATPFAHMPDPPRLKRYHVSSDPNSDQAQLSLQFSQPLSAVARPDWSLNNGRVLYTESRNNSVFLGVQFLDLQRPATLTIPQGSLYSAISGLASVSVTVVEFSPDLPTAIAASVNSAAALTALLGSATPLRIARSILHSQFLSWTGSLAVPALPPLYRQMVRFDPTPCHQQPCTASQTLLAFFKEVTQLLKHASMPQAQG